jgi:uncharacterized Tic20 family protein
MNQPDLITMTLLLFTAAFLLVSLPLGMVILAETGISVLEDGPVFLLLSVCAPLPLVLIGLFCVYQGVVNAMRAVADRPIHYPLSIPFVR